MASASDPPAHPALQPADRLILPPLPPRAAVETSIGPPHYPAESTQSHAFVQPSLRARKGHANSDSFFGASDGIFGTQARRIFAGVADRHNVIVSAVSSTPCGYTLLPSILRSLAASARGYRRYPASLS